MFGLLVSAPRSGAAALRGVVGLACRFEPGAGLPRRFSEPLRRRLGLGVDCAVPRLSGLRASASHARPSPAGWDPDPALELSRASRASAGRPLACSDPPKESDRRRRRGHSSTDRVRAVVPSQRRDRALPLGLVRASASDPTPARARERRAANRPLVELSPQPLRPGAALLLLEAAFACGLGRLRRDALALDAERLAQLATSRSTASSRLRDWLRSSCATARSTGPVRAITRRFCVVA